METTLCFSQHPWLLLLLPLGLCKLLSFTLSVLKWVHAYFLRPAKNLKKYGSWALVTGPTDGIGKAFAFQLAQEGLNVVLVGRNPMKLKEVSDGIQGKYEGLKVKTVLVDFSGDLDGGVRRVREAVEGLDVGVLVNNVGVTYPYARFFDEVDEKLLSAVIKVNVEGVSKVTQAVLPGMVERRRGAIVNIGSGMAAAIPSAPLHALYSASKAWNLPPQEPPTLTRQDGGEVNHGDSVSKAVVDLIHVRIRGPALFQIL
ncbi:unnamed protein product [Cuscuta europaea]|uniref:Uncharacterized protein n=1 Tax=Cuscuta europaea TaxID=41803 RepID=A0A9P0ZWU1_CUSEU|nr:unnamed protein product [Cuscuta europaea]